jgi:uncharacterized membrane protein YdbT with pleckstrin-like domain
MTNLQDGYYYSLGRKTFIFFILQNSAAAIGFLSLALLLWIMSAAVGSRLGSIGDLMTIGGTLLFALAIIAEIIAGIAARLKYTTSRVMLDNSALHVTKGILSKNEVAIPYRRLQSIAIKQSFLYRLVGIGHVVITTTTDLEQPGEIENEADDEVVPLMDYDLATAVANQLTKRAEIERMQMVAPSASPHSN